MTERWAVNSTATRPPKSFRSDQKEFPCGTPGFWL
jgi:hypothetical protein